MRPKRWLLNVLIAADQLGNAILGGAPDETISSRAGRGAFLGRRLSGWLCRFLNWLEPDHCQQAVESEVHGTQESAAIRDLRNRSGQ